MRIIFTDQHNIISIFNIHKTLKCIFYDVLSHITAITRFHSLFALLPSHLPINSFHSCFLAFYAASYCCCCCSPFGPFELVRSTVWPRWPPCFSLYIVSNAILRLFSFSFPVCVLLSSQNRAFHFDLAVFLLVRPCDSYLP